MPYILLAIGLIAAVVWAVKWRSDQVQSKEICSRCGAEMRFRERQFRGSALEQFWQCTNADCGYRRSA